MELEGVPQEYIQTCFVAVMDETEAAKLMSIPAAKARETKWPFEDRLIVLRMMWDSPNLAPCFIAMEAKHKAAAAKAADAIARAKAAAETIARFAKKHIAAKKLLANVPKATTTPDMHLSDQAPFAGIDERPVAAAVAVNWEDMELLDIPREYIWFCFFAMTGGPEALQFPSNCPPALGASDRFNGMSFAEKVSFFTALDRIATIRQLIVSQQLPMESRATEDQIIYVDAVKKSFAEIWRVPEAEVDHLWSIAVV